MLGRSRYPTLARVRRRRLARAAVPLSAAALLAGLALAGGATSGSLGSTSDNSANSLSAAPDFVGPSASRSVIAKGEGGTPGYVRQGGSYQVYAEVTDSGNPASGVAGVSSDTSSLTPLATATPLAAGSFSIGGLSYNRRGDALVAGTPLSEGTYSYALTSTDAAGNAHTQSGFTVTVDNTAPGAADVQTANGGSTGSSAEAGDAITYSFSEAIEPGTVLSGWDGGATNVVVQLVNELVASNDGIRVFDSSDASQLPLGTVDLGRTDYVGGLTGGEVARFGAAGVPSTMQMSGNTISIVLGTHSGQAPLTAAANGTMSWSPAPAPTDRAGNTVAAGAAGESGGGDSEF